MRPLHNIINPNNNAWVWARVYGANGRVLGDLPNSHLYLVPRLTSLTDTAPWLLWSHNPSHHFMLTPLCGPINTRSRYPRIMATGRPWDPNVPPRNLCPDCTFWAQERGFTPNFQADLRARG